MYKEKISFKNKIIIITGGTGIIGSKVVSAFIEFGAHVVICDIKNNNKSNKDLYNKKRLEYIRVDISKLNSIKEIVEKIYKTYKKIDVWINTAYPRTLDWHTDIASITVESWNKNIAMHLGGYFWSSKVVLDKMKKQGYGNLINFSSIYGIIGPNFTIYEGTKMTMPVAYSAIKGAINSLTRYLATYYGPYGIRVNSVCPGGVLLKQNKKFIKKYSKLTPLRRLAYAEEIAMPTLFLASEGASYITGHTLVVDGGITIQ